MLWVASFVWGMFVNNDIQRIHGMEGWKFIPETWTILLLCVLTRQEIFTSLSLILKAFNELPRLKNTTIKFLIPNILCPGIDEARSSPQPHLTKTSAAP